MKIIVQRTDDMSEWAACAPPARRTPHWFLDFSSGVGVSLTSLIMLRKDGGGGSPTGGSWRMPMVDDDDDGRCCWLLLVLLVLFLHAIAAGAEFLIALEKLVFENYMRGQ